MTEKFDPERHLTRADIAQLRGPFVKKPGDNADPSEWVRWAEEVSGHMTHANSILAYRDAKRAEASRAAERTRRRAR